MTEPGLTDGNARIDWVDAREANLRSWEERVPLHEKSYGLANYDDPEHKIAHLHQDLAAMAAYLPGGSVAGLDVCHLQCHIGTDTISLAREGASVTGLDFSASALEVGQRLAKKYGLKVNWVESDVLAARQAITGNFDVVYTSVGTIGWLSDLGQWAEQIAALLRPGGLFYIFDAHPFLYTIDEDATGLRVQHRYFPNGTAQQWDDDRDYSSEARLINTRTYEWPHSIAEILNSLISAGLRIERFDEGQVLPWQFNPQMVAVDGGWAWPEPARQLLPTTFTLIATKRT